MHSQCSLTCHILHWVVLGDTSCQEWPRGRCCSWTSVGSLWLDSFRWNKPSGRAACQYCNKDREETGGLLYIYYISAFVFNSPLPQTHLCDLFLVIKSLTSPERCISLGPRNTLILLIKSSPGESSAIGESKIMNIIGKSKMEGRRHTRSNSITNFAQTCIKHMDQPMGKEERMREIEVQESRCIHNSQNRRRVCKELSFGWS